MQKSYHATAPRYRKRIPPATSIFDKSGLLFRQQYVDSVDGLSWDLIQGVFEPLPRLDVVDLASG
jgi:hypothetical protein